MPKQRMCGKCKHPAHRNRCLKKAIIPIPGKKFVLETDCPCSPYHSASKKNPN